MTTADSKANDSLTAILFAVFAVACVVAFLAYRGSDVGQLPSFIGNLGGGPLLGIEAVRDSIVGVVAAALIGISWFGLGSVIAKFLKRESRPSRVFEIAFTTAIGTGIWSLIWFFLGFGAIDRNPAGFGAGSGTGAGFLSFIWFHIRIVGLYSRPIAVAAVLIGIALAIVGIRGLLGRHEGTNGTERRPLSENVLLFMAAFSILLTFIASLAPPIAKDTLLYHVAVPKAFIAQGGSAMVDGNIASYLAMGTEMHYIWAMLLGGMFSPRAAEAAAGATGFLFFPLLLLVMYGCMRELNRSRVWALIATVVVATVPTAYHVASSGYIDLALALFVTLAVYSLTRWWKEPSIGWIVLISIFLGAALSIKLTAIFVMAAFALIILMRARGSERASNVVIGGFAALLLAGVIASPWYIRTWVATGSPVFPFYMSIWPGKANGWDVERSNLFQAMNSQYGGVDTNKLNLVTAPVRASIVAQPEQAEYYDGVLGVAFLIGLPVLVWALWKFDLAIEIKIVAGVAGIMYLFWLFSSEQLRYLLPITPLLAIAIVASAEAVAKTRERLGMVLHYSFVAACICGIVTSFAWFCQKAPLRVVLGGETRDQYLARNLDYYPYYQSINAETPANSKVWLINMRRDTYNIERPVFSDYLFEDWTLRKMVWESRSLQELRSKAAAMNVQYVLARHDFLFDYDSSTLVDDKRPRAENEAKLKMAKDFILDPERTVKADSKFSLTKVF